MPGRVAAKAPEAEPFFIEPSASLVLVVSAANGELEWATSGMNIARVDGHDEALELMCRAEAEVVVVGVGEDDADAAMNFLERARALTAGHPGIPLVLLSSTQTVDVERAYRAGATDVWFSSAGSVVLQRRLALLTQTRRTFEELTASARKLERAQRVARFATWEWDLATHRVRWSGELRELLRVGPRVQVGVASVLGMVHPSERTRVQSILERIIETGQAHRFDHRAPETDASERFVEQFCELTGDRDGIPARIEGFVIDVTERKLAEREIHELVNYDRLTGLPNRLNFLDLLERAIRRNERSGSATAVALVDIDRFKSINESLGEEAGDELLRELAKRLAGRVRKSDLLAREGAFSVARRGGDEFLVLIEQVRAPREAAVAARRVLDAIRQPFYLDGEEVHLSACVGISLSYDAPEGEDIIRQAELAMYAAKREGRGGFRFFDNSMNDEVVARFDMEQQLRRAISRDELIVFYQPLVNARTREFVGVEALVRWEHPSLGILPAEDFVPLAEESDLIVPIGRWVLQTACQQVADWRDAGHGNMRLSVNLSPRELLASGFLESVAEALERTGLDASELELELTERGVMQNDERTMGLLHRLKSMGVRLAVDDFGTGQTTFHYLKHFPLNTLKIDKSFTRGIGLDDKDDAITRALLAMARRLKLNVVAEGVENEVQMSFLDRHRCDEVQGFLFGRPEAAAALTAALAHRLRTA